METLRQISEDYQSILYEALSSEEISEETLEKIKLIDDKFDEKIGNMACIVQELKANCLIVNNEIDRLTEKLARWHKNIKSLTKYMICEMGLVGKKKVNTALYSVSLRKSEVCEIDSEFIKEAKEKNLSSLLRIVPERTEPDKKAIKEYINSGHELIHARITENQNLNIK